MAFFLSVSVQLAVQHHTAENRGWNWPGLTTQAWQCVLDELHAEVWPDTTWKKIVHEMAFENGL